MAVEVRIVLADDHPVVRRGLHLLLATEPGFAIVGETGDGLKVLPLVEELRPDVVLLDMMMPGLNGLEIARQLTAKKSPSRVLVLSMHADEAYVLEALANGAAGYVLKDSSGEELVRAVREVAAGRRYLAPPFSDRAVELWAKTGVRTGSNDPYDQLTTREREVLQLAAEGLGNAEIGKRLFISARTVEAHRAHVLEKLGLDSQTALVRYALRRGVIQ